MPTKLGIAKLKAVILLACELGNVIDKSLKATGFGKYTPFMGLADELTALDGISWSDVKAEVMDLDAAERAELHEAMKAKFDIADNKLEATIEDAVGVINDAVALFAKAKSLASNLKG